MLFFSIAAYTAFGIFCIYCIVSGVKKLNEKKAEQESPDYYVDKNGNAVTIGSLMFESIQEFFPLPIQYLLKLMAKRNSNT